MSLVDSFISKCEVKTSFTTVDGEILFVSQDANKKLTILNGPYEDNLEKVKKAGRFTGKLNSMTYLPFTGKKGDENVLVVGLGLGNDVILEKVRHAGANAFSKIQYEKLSTVQIHTSTLHEIKGLKEPKAVLKAFLEGFFLSMYKFDKYKKEKNTDRISPEKVILVCDKNEKSDCEELAMDIVHIAESTNICRNWSNEPSNFGTPEFYAKEAQKLAKEYGMKCTVLSEKEAAKEGMNLFLAVGQGAEREGKIIVLDYHPKNAKKTVALVGKGVTFDSGGISIKPSLRMEEMKHDMTGAATLFAATLLAAKRKVKNRIVTILAFTENMPDGNAVQPGNVIKARNGLTVEINNTDAEGRLVLADVLDYAHEFKPDCIVNAATLTGAVLVALGKHCCGIMGNNQALIDQLKNIGNENFERMWQLPLFDEYLDDMRTDCADLRNVANDGNGGTIRGGIFLKQFIRKGMSWAHLDIAGTASGVTHLPYCPKKGATGLHVRSIAQFLGEYK